MGECRFDGCRKLLRGVHLRYAERRAVGVRLHEQGHSQFRDDLRRVERFAAAQEDLAGQVDTPCERAFGGDLVEGDDRRGHRARRIGNAHHVEVALQLAVLAGRAVNDDQRVVERLAHTVDGDREIILVHLPLPPVGGRMVPVAAVEVDDRDVVFRVVEGRLDLGGALKGDFPFGRIAARQEGYLQTCHFRGCIYLCIGIPVSPAPSGRTPWLRRACRRYAAPR